MNLSDLSLYSSDMLQIFWGLGLEFRLKPFNMFGMDFISITSVDVYFLGPTLRGWGWAHRSTRGMGTFLYVLKDSLIYLNLFQNVGFP